MDDKAIVQTLRRLHAAGALKPEEGLVMADSRPREEFYDLASDPFELRNVATDLRYEKELSRHRQALADWIGRNGDRGREPEPEPEPVYLGYVRDDRPEAGGGQRRGRFEENVELMLRWNREHPMDAWEPPPATPPH
jgi:hypothetical protein